MSSTSALSAQASTASVCPLPICLLHTSHNIRVLESDTTVGGVWSSTRHYPLFWAQTGARVSGFPDQPFKAPVDC